ncbi:hypothetical protein V2J09_023549 [Rumex salicifolius]
MTEMESMVHDTTDQSLEMDSSVLDNTDQSLGSSDTDIRHVVVEDQSLRVKSFDTQMGGMDIAGPESVAHSDAGDVITVEPSGDMKNESKPSVSDILYKSDAQNGNSDENILSMDGRSINGETLQLGKAPSQLNSNVMHSDHASVRSSGVRSLGNGFEMGDMVWGKVKSHPWWPGYIFNEAFTSSSVWRTKKDDQVLVAFFGDSSYGWFDPAELVPYEPHFIEKSQQSTSRNFVKAVEESIDEACRRTALGLTCFCRNPNNFRPTRVPGHVAVDVFDYEPGGIYSTDQIQKSRDNFQPEQILSFIEQLAAAPRKGTTTLDYMREKAAAIACRRAVFVEFDETYAQAFGHKPVRPIAAPPPTVDQSIQARLSGPLVIAESLSGRKSSAKAAKPREKSKKDRYLFKRRDEPDEVGASQTGLGNASSFSSSPCEDRQSNPAVGDFSFQKRDEPVLGRDQVDGTASAGDDGPASSHSLSKAATGAGKESEHTGTSSEKKVVGGDKGASKQSHTPTLKRKKAGLLKGPLKKSSAEKSELGEKKKRKTTGVQGSSDHPQKDSSIHIGGLSGEGEIPERPVQVGPPSNVEFQLKGITASSDVVPSGASTDYLPSVKNDGKLEHLLSDLKALAVDPFHGRDRNRPKIARQLFLRFRSLVFLKSAAASAPASGDTEASEGRSARASSGGDNTRSAPPSRPPKPLGRTDDPTKGDRKRAPSDRQEDVAVKRLKKASVVKSEKRKPHEMQHLEGKGKSSVAASPRLGTRVETIKKQPPKVRVEEPTFLVMKYPPGTSLPSSAELKARFARFGPMDTSQMRIFYTTYTCRILFLYKEDAETAYRFALGNKSAFANVRFTLRPNTVASSDTQTEKPSRTGEEMANAVDTLHQRPSSSVQLKSCLKKPGGDEGVSQNSGGGRGARVRFNMAETRATASSITGNGGSGVVKTTDPRTNNNNTSSSLSVAMDVVHNNNQPETFLKNPLHPPLVSPLHNHHHHPPSVEASSPANYAQHTQTTRLPPLLPPPLSYPPPSRQPVDISQQMLSLLTRCNDVVSNVKSILGYVPYHPL